MKRLPLGAAMFKKKHSIDALFIILVYGMFTMLALMLVLIGTLIYRRTVNSADERGSGRAAVYYVANKIRAGDTVGGIYMKSYVPDPAKADKGIYMEAKEGEGGISALIIEEDGVQTMIYEYEGALYEWIKFESDPFMPSLGIRIISAGTLSITQDAGGFMISAAGSGGAGQSVYISRRT